MTPGKSPHNAHHKSIYWKLKWNESRFDAFNCIQIVLLCLHIFHLSFKFQLKENRFSFHLFFFLWFSLWFILCDDAETSDREKKTKMAFSSFYPELSSIALWTMPKNRNEKKWKMNGNEREQSKWMWFCAFMKDMKTHIV